MSRCDVCERDVDTGVACGECGPDASAIEDAAREESERQTAEAIAAWCDRMGWDHTADLIRDGEWKRATT